MRLGQGSFIGANVHEKGVEPKIQDLDGLRELWLSLLHSKPSVHLQNGRGCLKSTPPLPPTGLSRSLSQTLLSASDGRPIATEPL